MGRMLEIVTPLHKATKRDYVARMMDDKVNCMMKAKEYEFDYWDGDRRYGYGGYKYIDGRWKPVAQALIDIYGLKSARSVSRCRLRQGLSAVRDEEAPARASKSSASISPSTGSPTPSEDIRPLSVPLSRAGCLSLRRQAASTS